MAQREGIVDVDTIPSPQVEPVTATLVEEEEQAPMMVRMDIDSHDSAQRHKPVTTGNPQQPARAEAAHRTNGGDSEQTESDAVRPQPGEGSMQQEEGQIEDITGNPESGGEEREPEAGTSTTL
jgi:hypothetical protein